VAGPILLLEPAQAPLGERGPRLIEAIVEAAYNDVVAHGVAMVAVPRQRRHPVGAHEPHAVRQRLVVGDRCTAFADREVRVGEEAERTGESESL
jgi:hypothetical protein